ncbi:hypothetical protein [Psychrobacillus soli]|uniref:Lipopolysaccharide biosynthesis protein n=1 Tax=Psychrobacillus soli TaxID=1543965 RepID=A0A544SIV5_9BACI|nr:hypothetical protein [Psychrobacillus soli]TQR05146.1 hypothetical protein FG383_19750 [Psychrobacillus soli]
MAENKTYKLYDSLEFFWKKKIWFIIIPVIVALLGYVGSMFIPKDGEYVGRSTMFTGSVKLEALTNPDHIMAQYGEHFTGKAEVFVPTRSYIKAEVYGETEEQVTKELTLFDDQLLAGLMAQNDKVVDGTQRYALAQSARIQTFQEAIESYKQALADTDIEPVINHYTLLLSQAEQELTNAMATEQRVRNDIISYEKPALANAYVVKTKSYGLEGAVAGFILGLLFTIFILSLWKYILEARGSKQA